mmetsp:Transcript_17611/g.24830  ORF Transcript_17611/g.24830 Transcript_17611/m.24830 type:complete len:606 (+) Transcript_17611:32-1849(+)
MLRNTRRRRKLRYGNKSNTRHFQKGIGRYVVIAGLILIALQCAIFFIYSQGGGKNDSRGDHHNAKDPDSLLRALGRKNRKHKLYCKKHPHSIECQDEQHGQEQEQEQHYSHRERTVVETPNNNDHVQYENGLSSFDNAIEQNLQPMPFTLSEIKSDDLTHVSSEQSGVFQAYVIPDVSTFYQETPGSMIAKIPRYKGLAGKFINLSPQKLDLYWHSGQGDGVHIAGAGPMEAVGTATYIGHQFYFASPTNTRDIKQRFHVVSGNCIYVYDPFEDGEMSLGDISSHHFDKYVVQKKNLQFGNIYKQLTGRDWLALYPLRGPPMHKMWNADYFGQNHWVATAETHFIEEPPENLLHSVDSEQIHHHYKDSDERPLAEYRSKHDRLNMTMTVISCAPRAFEIKNFLSQVEVDHVVHMATGMKLSLSTTSGSDGSERRTDSDTRTSYNSWIRRDRSLIIDSIYRRAADLMRIDEALLRTRSKGERPDLDYLSDAAEELQLVHYSSGQQYTPHHDWGHPSVSKTRQPSRFATLLLYLNEGMNGGETSFPRYLNAHDAGVLDVVPEIGKAVLFYSLLPDGNFDDLSQHQAKPVIDGEKWLINLWTWDPRFR